VSPPQPRAARPVGWRRRPARIPRRAVLQRPKQRSDGTERTLMWLSTSAHRFPGSPAHSAAVWRFDPSVLRVFRAVAHPQPAGLSPRFPRERPALSGVVLTTLSNSFCQSSSVVRRPFSHDPMLSFRTTTPSVTARSWQGTGCSGCTRSRSPTARTCSAAIYEAPRCLRTACPAHRSAGPARRRCRSVRVCRRGSHAGVFLLVRLLMRERRSRRRV